MTRPAAFSLLIPLLLLLASPGGAAPHLSMQEWSEQLRPDAFSDDTLATSWQSYPLPGVEGSLLPELAVRFQPQLPEVDGDLDDWPLVRWNQVRSHMSVVRGTWSGTTDASMRFAVLWNERGILIGAQATDDSIVLEPVNGRDPDAFFVSFGTRSSSAQRWWRGADRTLQLWPDGRVISTTFLRNRRRVLFDAQLLGAQGAVQLGKGHKGRSGNSVVQGSLTAELFVPWDVLFPLLPHEALQSMINVLYDDVDGRESTLLAAATRVDSSRVQTSWSRMTFTGSPPAGTTVFSSASRHLEPGVAFEWAALRLGAQASWRLQWRMGDERAAVDCPSGPAIVRLHDVDVPARLWQRQRALPMQVQLGDETRSFTYHAVPDADVLSGDIEELRQFEAMQDPDAAFPRVPDVNVRLAEVTRAVRVALGAWRERRYHDSGIAVWRASLCQILEKRIARAELLRDQIVEPQNTVERWNEAFPLRTARGVPVGRVLTRGYRSELDGSVQPYALYVSSRVDDTDVPLVVGLHPVDRNELDLFERTSLARQTEAHGWISVCPYGRGDTGFLHAGETDVLDVIDRVAADLPVDRSRLFVLGSGMGGTATWLLSLRHPDLFAAATVVSAYGDMDRENFLELLGYHPRELFHFQTMNPVRLVRPGLHTHYRIHHTSGDPVINVEHAQLMQQKLQEYGVDSELVVDNDGRHGEPLLEAHLQSIFDFFASQPPGRSGQPRQEWFGGTGGPLATVYSRGPFTIVYGTRPLPPGTSPVGEERRAGKSVTGPQADLRTAQQFAMEWESIYSGRPRLIPDTLVTAELQSQHNLVLVGDPRSNRVLAQVASDLPVQWRGDGFLLVGHYYAFEQNGVVFAAPHPQQPERTLVVVSGMAERLGSFEKSLLKLGADYIVTDDEHRFVDIGQFGGFMPPQGGGSR